MPSTLSMLITMSAMMIVFTASQKLSLSLTLPSSSSGSSSLTPIQSNSRLPRIWMYGSVISSAANDVRAVISTTMPAVPTMNARFWSRGLSERHASAMTSALSPLNTTLMTAILNSAIQVSGLLSAASIAGDSGLNSSKSPRYRPSITRACRNDYAMLSEGLQRAFNNMTGTLQRLRLLALTGKGHRERVAAAVGILDERDVGAVQLDDFVHDREAESAAVGVTAEKPVKPLEDALPLLDRDQRAIVADRQTWRIRPDTNRHAAILR